MKEEFPNLKDSEQIFVQKKTTETLLNDKSEQLKREKEKKKINLGKYFKKKDNPGNDDYSIE